MKNLFILNPEKILHHSDDIPQRDVIAFDFCYLLDK
jgi:hypothetical protein